MKVILSEVSIERFLRLREKLKDEEKFMAYLLCTKGELVAIDSERIELWNKLDKLLK